MNRIFCRVDVEISKPASTRNHPTSDLIISKTPLKGVNLRKTPIIGVNLGKNTLQGVISGEERDQ